MTGVQTCALPISVGDLGDGTARQSADRRDRSPRVQGTAAQGILRRTRPEGPDGDRQRRELLAHARSAHASADQRRPGGADRPRYLHPRTDTRCRRADHPQRVHDRRRQHVRRARRQAGAGRDPRSRDPRQTGEQRALPRSPAALRHPARAPCRVRDPRSGMGCRSHRPPRIERPVPAAGRRRSRRDHRGDRARDPHLTAFRRRPAHQWARSAGSCRPRPRGRGRDDHAASARAARLDRR